MPRSVFFSFHHKRDIIRVTRIKNCGITKGEVVKDFLDPAGWEEVKRKGQKQVKTWIDNNMNGTSVLIVCIGNQTYKRRWVRYEIRKAHKEGKGILGIRIHNMKDFKEKDDEGVNPIDTFHFNQNGREICFSSLYSTYDWEEDDGYSNIKKWIDKAALKAGR
jgi:hypothetical protein